MRLFFFLNAGIIKKIIYWEVIIYEIIHKEKQERFYTQWSR